MAAAQNSPPPRRPRPDWSSGLPKHLLETIVKRLDSGSDAASFRSVCSPWRDAVPFAAFEPLLLLSSGPAGSESVAFYSVTEEKVFTLPPFPELRGKVLCGASCGWLALMDESAAVTLLNPFTGARVELPPADQHVADSSSWAPVSRSEDGRRWLEHRPVDAYHGKSAAGAEARVVKLADMRQVFFHEVVLSAPPDADGRQCVAMALLPCSSEVAFCRVGVDTAWTLLDTNLECNVLSVVHCQGRFVAVTCVGEISICSEIVAGEAPTMTPMPSLSPPLEVCNRSYLECNGELHLVGAVVTMFHGARRFTYINVVYKCDLLHQTPAWSMVDYVGDLTLFVSKTFSSSFSGARVSKYKRNAVYFSEPLYADEDDQEHRLEVADIASGESEVEAAFHQKLQGSEALGWIRPNPWKGGGLLITRKYHNNDQLQASSAPVAKEGNKAGGIQFSGA